MVTSRLNFPWNQSTSRRTSARSSRLPGKRGTSSPSTGCRFSSSAMYSEIAYVPHNTGPASISNTGSSPAGFSCNRSSLTSHGCSSTTSTWRPSSASVIRMERDNGQSLKCQSLCIVFAYISPWQEIHRASPPRRFASFKFWSLDCIKDKQLAVPHLANECQCGQGAAA